MLCYVLGSEASMLFGIAYGTMVERRNCFVYLSAVMVGGAFYGASYGAWQL